MIETTLPVAITVDVTIHNGQVITACHNLAESAVTLDQFDADLSNHVRLQTLSVLGGNAAARMDSWAGVLWLAYRAPDDRGHLIRFDTGESYDLGLAFGQRPFALGEGFCAWLIGATMVRILPLGTPVHTAVPKVIDIAPTGLSHIELREVPEGNVIVLRPFALSWESQRQLHPWGVGFVAAPPYVVAESHQGGIVGAIDGHAGRLHLWPSDQVRDPRVAIFPGEDRAAVIGWQINGQPVRLAIVSPADLQPVAEPQEPPVPDPVATSGLARPAFPRKAWVWSFHSHTEAYPPDVPLSDYAGNCISVVSRETDPGMMARDLARVSGLAQPMLVEAKPEHFGGALNPNLTIAWWAAGGDEQSLAEHVAIADGLEPKVPIVAYMDRGSAQDWPASKPDWMTEKTWPTAQAYRNPGESLSDFDGRILELLARLTSYGHYIGVVLGFYDRNGQQPIADVLECMDLYDRWIREYPVVAVGLFADRRPGGITSHPELREPALHFLRGFVARPNRYDGWNSDNIDSDLRNKMGQSVELAMLSAKEKARIVALLGDESNGHQPEPGWPDVPDRSADVQAIRDRIAQSHEELTEAGAAWVRRTFAWEHRSEGFGVVKAKDGSSNNFDGETNDVVAWANGRHWDIYRDGGFVIWREHGQNEPDNMAAIKPRWRPPTDPGPF